MPVLDGRAERPDAAERHGRRAAGERDPPPLMRLCRGEVIVCVPLPHPVKWVGNGGSGKGCLSSAPTPVEADGENDRPRRRETPVAKTNPS